jgi:hypothetical protein
MIFNNTVVNRIALAITLALLWNGPSGRAAEPGRVWLLGGYGDSPQYRGVMIYQEGKGILWRHLGHGLLFYDCCMRPNGNVIFVDGRVSVTEMVPDRDKGEGGTVVWKYDVGSAEPSVERGVGPATGMYRVEAGSCWLQPDGTVIVSEGGPCRLVVLGSDGKVLRTVPLPRQDDVGPVWEDPHRQLKQVRPDAAGVQWVAFGHAAFAKAVNDAGEVLRTIRVPIPPDKKRGKEVSDPRKRKGLEVYAAVPLPSGNVLLSTWLPALFEYDAKGEVVWEFTQEDATKNGIGKLGFPHGVVRLANGNTVFCNWATVTSKLVVEVSTDKKEVWSLDRKDLGEGNGCRIMNVQLLRPDGKSPATTPDGRVAPVEKPSTPRPE